MNLDENKTKTLETSLFLNLDDTRILVKKSDQSIITSNVLDEAKIKNVVSVEPYDYITDINYYLLGDYKYVYEGGFVDTPDKMDTNFVDMSSVAFVDNSHFMRSSVSLSSDMLKAGSLPENPFEMVLYSDDANILNTIQTVYFKNGRLWGVDTSYKYDVKVVGLLKERTEQVYFSEKLCQIMDLSRQQFSIDIVYKENYRTMTKTFRNVVIDPKITNPQGLSFDKEVLGTLTGERVELLKENNFVLHVDGERYAKNSFEKERINTETDVIKNIYFEIEGNDIKQTAKFLENNNKEFDIKDYIYNFFKEKEQFAIFIKDYAYTNEICSELKDNGFDTLSCFRASVTGYDNTKVINQYVNLVISVAAILFINFLIIILGNSLLKFKRNDYIIFKMIGMENSMCSKINYFEMLIYAILSNFLLVIIASIVKSSVYELLIVEMFKYVKFYDYLIVFLITLVSTIYLTYKFNKYIEKSTKITVMKEE